MNSQKAASPETVSRSALKALGRKGTVPPGFMASVLMKLPPPSPWILSWAQVYIFFYGILSDTAIS